MTTASDLTAATARRPWYQSIAGNLLLAFALIAALTVSATLLSLIRFYQIDAVMNRLTGVSLPLVQSSLGVEAKTKALVRGGEAENTVSIRQELQADCYAGMWAHYTNQRNILEVGDLEEGLRAAAAIGETHKPQVVSSPAKTPTDRTGHYGLGWNVGHDPAGRLVLSHSGAFDLGAATCVVLVPAEKLGIDLQRRAETLSVNEFVQLARALS